MSGSIRCSTRSEPIHNHAIPPIQIQSIAGAVAAARIHAHRSDNGRVPGRRIRHARGPVHARLHYPAEYSQRSVRLDVRYHVRAQRSGETQHDGHDQQGDFVDERVDRRCGRNHAPTTSSVLPEHHGNDGEFVARLQPEWTRVEPVPIHDRRHRAAAPRSRRAACRSIPSGRPQSTEGSCS